MKKQLPSQGEPDHYRLDLYYYTLSNVVLIERVLTKNRQYNPEIKVEDLRIGRWDLEPLAKLLLEIKEELDNETKLGTTSNS